MNSAVIIALVTGIPAILAAITALVQALKAKSTANGAANTASSVQAQVSTHQVEEHNMFPIQPPTSTGEDTPKL